MRAESQCPTSPVVAVFDLDGTLTDGDTYVAFLLQVLRSDPLKLGRCLGLPYELAMLKLGCLSNDRLKANFLCALLHGATREEVARHAAAFVDRRLPGMIKPAALRRIAWHRARQHRLVLASASLDLYAPLIASRLGFDAVLCTRVTWRNGRVTGELAGDNLRGAAKLQAVRELIGRQTEKPIVFAYSDSHTDLPLLIFADHGVAIDPDRVLRREAPRSGLHTERWRG